MKKITLFLIFLISSVNYGQNAQDIIDNLKKDLQNKPDDKKKAIIYSDLTWYYSNISLDSAMIYGEKAIIEATKLKDSTLIAQVYSDVGAVYFRKGNYEIAKQNYLVAKQIRKKLKNFNGVNKINANLASIYLNTSDYKKAMSVSLETLNYFESIGDLKNMYIIKSTIGEIYHKLNNYPKAIQYYNEAISYNEKNKLYTLLCASYLNLGNAYKEIKDFKKAEYNYSKGFTNCNLVGNLKANAILKQNLGIIKSYQDSSALAKKLFKESENLNRNDHFTIDKANLKISIVRELIKDKKYSEALIHLKKIKYTFKKENSKVDLLNVYKFLIPVYANLNKPDSVSFALDNYLFLKESETQSTVLKQTAELETKYQTTKKEKQIIQQQAEAKQKNTYLIGLSVLALLISLVGFLIYKQQKQKNQQQEQEFALKSAIEKIESQNKLQEQRLSISRDLHDNIGAQLTFIISSVDNVKYAFDITNPKLDNKLTNISSFAQETILELRDTIWAMNSDQISYEDLEVRINNFLEKAKEAKEEISFSFAIEESLKTQKLSSVQGMNMYRTIQEAINNSFKYAQADVISVNIRPNGNQTAIVIKDNGKGFDVQSIEKGNGLNNMKKRIEEIGGKLALSSDDDGTIIEILI